MNDSYSGQDVERGFPQNLGADIDRACGLPQVSGSYGETAAVAQAWLVAYTRCQAAQHSLRSALLAL